MIPANFKAAFLLVLFVLTVSFPVFAEQTQGEHNQKKIDSARMIKEQVSAEAGEQYSSAEQQGEFSVIRLFQGLGLCIAVFLTGVHLYKKYVLKDELKTERSIKILEKIPLTAKSQLCLVKYNNKKLLVAVGPENVSFYHDSDILNDLADVNEMPDFLPSKELCKEKVN